MVYSKKPVAETAITVSVKGEQRRKEGESEINTFMVEFTCAIDFAAWLEIATKAMKENEYISLEHRYMGICEMIPHEIMMTGKITRKFRRIYPPRPVK